MLQQVFHGLRVREEILIQGVMLGCQVAFGLRFSAISFHFLIVAQNAWGFARCEL